VRGTILHDFGTFADISIRGAIINLRCMDYQFQPYPGADVPLDDSRSQPLVTRGHVEVDPEA
jgi:hypothetical protein